MLPVYPQASNKTHNDYLSFSFLYVSQKSSFIYGPTIARIDDAINFVIADTGESALISSKNSDELPTELLVKVNSMYRKLHVNHITGHI